MSGPAPRPGDRVRVTYEGVYRHNGTDGGMLIDVGGDLWGLPVGSAVEILPPSEPPEGTLIIGHEQESDRGVNMPWVFQTTEIAGETYLYIDRTEVEITGGTATVEAFEDDHATMDIVASVSSAADLRKLIADLQAQEATMLVAERVRDGQR